MDETRSIRPIADGDLDDCASLFVEVFNAPPWNDSWTHETALTRLSDIAASPGSRGLAAVRGGRIDGFALGQIEQWHSGRHFYLREMCVRPDLQRQGIGASLLSELDVLLVTDGVESVYLIAAPGPTESFYETNGYHRSQHVIVMLRRVVS